LKARLWSADGLPPLSPAGLAPHLVQIEIPKVICASGKPIIWNTGFNFFRDVLQFATMLVMIRLLPPGAYGHFGFVTSIVGFLSMFAFGNFIAHAL